MGSPFYVTIWLWKKIWKMNAEQGLFFNLGFFFFPKVREKKKYPFCLYSMMYLHSGILWYMDMLRSCHMSQDAIYDEREGRVRLQIFTSVLLLLWQNPSWFLHWSDIFFSLCLYFQNMEKLIWFLKSHCAPRN